MNKLAKILILLTASFHILFFYIESIGFMNPEILERFGLNETSGAIVKVWAFNQGFYNLFLAIGLFYGLVLVQTKKVQEGFAIIKCLLLIIIGAGVVLLISTPDKAIGAFIQSVPPLLALGLLLYKQRRI